MEKNNNNNFHSHSSSKLFRWQTQINWFIWFVPINMPFLWSAIGWFLEAQYNWHFNLPILIKFVGIPVTIILTIAILVWRAVRKVLPKNLGWRCILFVAIMMPISWGIIRCPLWGASEWLLGPEDDLRFFLTQLIVFIVSAVIIILILFIFIVIIGTILVIFEPIILISGILILTIAILVWRALLKVFPKIIGWYKSKKKKA